MRDLNKSKIHAQIEKFLIMINSIFQDFSKQPESTHDVTKNLIQIHDTK